MHVTGACSRRHASLILQGDTLAAGRSVSTPSVVRRIPQHTRSWKGWVRAVCPKQDNLSLHKVHMQGAALQEKVAVQIWAATILAAASTHPCTSGHSPEVQINSIPSITSNSDLQMQGELKLLLQLVGLASESLPATKEEFEQE